MVSKEEIMARRDELMERREEMMKRAEEIRERFQEKVDRDTVQSAAGWTLVSSGLAFGVTQFVKGNRGVGALLFPIALILSGAAVLGAAVAHRRGIHINDVEATLREQLSELDPIARMRVLRDMRSDFVPFVKHSHN